MRRNLLSRTFRSIVLVGVFALLTGVNVHAQRSIVRGTVVAASDGESIPGVNIVLLQSDSLVTGTVSGSDGIYALPQLMAGTYVLRATFVGFAMYSETLRIGRNDRLIINLVLEVAETELGEVIVEGDRGAGITRVLAGQTTITPADVDRIPSPDVSGDLVNILTTLPGIVSLGDRGGQLFIRGGEPWQNLVMLDGMWVYQPFHILGFFSSFPSEILKEVNVYAGGYTSQYGGRLSSVIDVTSRNGDKRKYAGTGSIAPFVSGFSLEGPVVTDVLSFLVSYRTSVIEEGASHLVKGDLPFEFDDLFAKVHAFVNSNSQISLSLLRTNDKGSVFEGNEFQPEQIIQWKNRAASVRYFVFPRAFPVMAEFIISGSRLKTSQSGADETVRFSKLSSINTNVNVTHFKRNAEIKWGLFARTLEMQSSLDGIFQGFSDRTEYNTEVGIYVEPEIRTYNGWQIRMGLRIHSFPSKNSGFLEPRLRAVKTNDKDEYTFAMGSFHQEIIGLVDRRDAAGVFTAWTSSPYERKVPEALHLILGYRRSLSQSTEISIEGYAKKLNNLFIPEWTAFPRFTTRLQSADGRVFGGDLRLEYRNKTFSGFVTYGLSSVRYTAKQEGIELWYGEKSLDFRPAHDRRHQLNVVASFDLRPFDVNVRWQYGSGLPYNRALGFDGFLLVDGNLDVFTDAGNRRVIYEKPYNGLLPTYHRLDITLQRLIDLPGRAQLTTMVGLINAYDRRNLFYLDVFTLRRVDQLPLIPTFGVKIEFE